MRIVFTLLRNVLLEMQSKILLYTQKKNFLLKSVLLFSIDFTSALSILLKSEVTSHFITIFGYLNDKNTYIVNNIILID